MHQSFVLKHVAEPPKMIMASIDGTAISLIVFIIVSLLIFFILPLPIFIKMFMCPFVFVGAQGYMIYKTYQDPYFFNVWMADLACKKTKNFIKAKDNVYGD